MHHWFTYPMAGHPCHPEFIDGRAHRAELDRMAELGVTGGGAAPPERAPARRGAWGVGVQPPGCHGAR
jgi:hypothetical protein